MWMLANLGFCGLAWWWLMRPPSDAVQPGKPGGAAYLRWLAPLLAFGFGLFATIPALHQVFVDIPIDPYWSDIVPSIQLYVRRLLSGEAVYVPMEFPGWTVLPTYLPMMWLPYIPAELLDFDYRWVAFYLFGIAVAAWVWQAWRSGGTWPVLTVLAGAPFLAIYLMLIGIRGQVFGMAVELMPVALYLFLALSLLGGSAWLWAAAITACLLSRYAMTFWLPVFFLVTLIAEGWWKAIRTGLMVAAGVLLLYVLPFLSRDWSILQNGLDYYHTTAVGQWHTQSFQEAGEKPFHLNQGFSFALYFYDLANGGVEHRLALNRRVHLIVCLGAALALLVGFFRWRHRIRWRLYLLVGLKFYLGIFYGLIHVPFSYLYWLPLFLALPIFAVVAVPGMGGKLCRDGKGAPVNYAAE